MGPPHVLQEYYAVLQQYLKNSVGPPHVLQQYYAVLQQYLKNNVDYSSTQYYVGPPLVFQ